MKAKSFVLGLFIILGACTEQEVIKELEEPQELIPQLKQNKSSLQHMTLVNSKIKMTPTQSTDLDEYDQYTWEHIANVSPLNYDGHYLSATSITIEGDVALVTYHKRGNIHKGALEIINISNPNTPASMGFIPFENADINTVAIDPFENNVIWVAGSSSKIGAALYKIVHDGFYQISSFNRINLSKGISGGISASANGIYVSQNHILVSCGKTVGGIAKIDKSNLEVIYSNEFSGAKGISGNSVNGIEFYVSLKVSAVNDILVQRVDNDVLHLSVQVSSSSHQTVDLPHDGKYDLQFSPINPAELYVSSGMKGAYSINILTGQSIKSTTSNMLPEGNTNAVHVDNEFIYLANGADGLHIASLDDSELSGTIDPIYHWDLPEKPASVNFVTARDGYVFVAKGLGGFHILKYNTDEEYETETPYNENGTPTNMTTVEYCPDIVSNIITKALPEGENIFDHSPEYFDNINSSFLLEDDAQVEVTFLHENAGYRNTLGYYTYSSEAPPKTIEDLRKIVIFPNASAKHSGGELIPGNTVKILGTFPKGTVFGFYLVSNGWSWQNIMTDGINTQYSDWVFNDNKRQQNLIFYDVECDAFVLCFEDMLLPRGDKDFNDAIFQISSTPDYAFRNSSYLQIR